MISNSTCFPLSHITNNISSSNSLGLNHPGFKSSSLFQSVQNDATYDTSYVEASSSTGIFSNQSNQYNYVPTNVTSFNEPVNQFSSNFPIQQPPKNSQDENEFFFRYYNHNTHNLINNNEYSNTYSTNYQNSQSLSSLQNSTKAASSLLNNYYTSNLTSYNSQNASNSHNLNKSSDFVDSLNSNGQTRYGLTCYAGQYDPSKYQSTMYHSENNASLNCSTTKTNENDLKKKIKRSNSTYSEYYTDKLNETLNETDTNESLFSPDKLKKANSFPKVSSSNNKKTRTKDKYRVVYNEHQRNELEKEFLFSKYITSRKKSDLASVLDLSQRQIKIWFQNRRAKDRKVTKQKKRTESSSNTSSSENSNKISLDESYQRLASTNTSSEYIVPLYNNWNNDNVSLSYSRQINSSLPRINYDINESYNLFDSSAYRYNS